MYQSTYIHISHIFLKNKTDTVMLETGEVTNREDSHFNADYGRPTPKMTDRQTTVVFDEFYYCSKFASNLSNESQQYVFFNIILP